MSPDLLLKAAILGLVEGPRSSFRSPPPGILSSSATGWAFVDERAKTFEIFIQLGAILAIVWLYRVRLGRTVLAARHDPGSRRFLVNLLIAFFPAALVGLLAHDWIKAHLFNPTVVAVALVVGGILILLIERWSPAPTGPGRERRAAPNRAWHWPGTGAVADPGNLALRGNHHGRLRPGAVPGSGDGVLLLPGHSGHAGGHDLRSAEELVGAGSRGRSDVRGRVYRLLFLGRDRGPGISVLTSPATASRLCLVSDRCSGPGCS